MKARDIMSRDLVTVRPEHGIRHAAQIMIDRDVSGLPVTDDDGRLVGMLTEGDLLGRAELGRDLPDAGPLDVEQRARALIKARSWKVGDVMTRDVATVAEDTSVAAVVAVLVDRGVKRVPVVREDRLVGIVSRRDLLRLFVARREENVPRGDMAMTRGIKARLGEEPGLAGTRIDVDVSDGVVRLRGTVALAVQRDAARVIAESVRGVIGVTDDLVVVPATGSKGRT